MSDHEQIRPMVSVVMITYGHEDFIREAIEGVLLQKVDFEVELIIADDNSPDNTELVVKDIKKNHPKGNWIRYTKHKNNKGMTSNFIWALKSCKGNYIALCEGDDYWTDELKLKKQVEFLQKNTKYIITGHNAQIINEKKIAHDNFKLTKSFCKDAKGEELKLGYWVLTLSMVFKNILTDDFFNLFNNKGIECTDTFLTSYLGKFGDYHYMPEIKPAVYRIHEGGVWSMKSDKIKYLKSINVIFSLAKFHKSEGDEVANRLFRRVYEKTECVKSANFYEGLSLKEKVYYKYLGYYSYRNMYDLPRTIYHILKQVLTIK